MATQDTGVPKHLKDDVHSTRLHSDQVREVDWFTRWIKFVERGRGCTYDEADHGPPVDASEKYAPCCWGWPGGGHTVPSPHLLGMHHALFVNTYVSVKRAVPR